MLGSGTCQMMWTGTCSRNGGRKKPEAALTSSQQPNMTSVEEDNEEYEPTFQEAKDEFEYWLQFYLEYAEMDNSHFNWKCKEGREPDVLAYLILEESEQRKFRN